MKILSLDVDFDLGYELTKTDKNNITRWIKEVSKPKYPLGVVVYESKILTITGYLEYYHIDTLLEDLHDFIQKEHEKGKGV